MINEPSTWYVVRTKPRQEVRAKQNLENQGASTYLPQFNVVKTLRGKRTEVQEVLFPGYVFASFEDAQHALHKVKNTFGVLGFVKFGERLAQLSNNEIDALRQLVEVQVQADKLTSKSPEHETPKVGEQVIITEGAFSGLPATLIELNGPERCAVLLELLHKQVRAELALSAIQKIT